MCCSTNISEGPESERCLTQFQLGLEEDYCLLETLLQAYKRIISLIRASKVKCSVNLRFKPY